MEFSILMTEMLKIVTKKFFRPKNRQFLQNSCFIIYVGSLCIGDKTCA